MQNTEMAINKVWLPGTLVKFTNGNLTRFPFRNFGTRKDSIYSTRTFIYDYRVGCDYKFNQDDILLFLDVHKDERTFYRFLFDNKIIELNVKAGHFEPFLNTLKIINE